MAIETTHMVESHKKYNTRDVKGNYADIAKALGGWSEVVKNPNEIGAAILRAKRQNEDGKSALLEFITNEDQEFSNMRPFG